jgi:branched-chain amino acid transport system substrate-binding protein
MKMKRILGLAGLIALCAVLLAVLFRHRDQEHSQITLGVILPLTGDAAVYGSALKNGIELARTEDAANGTPAIELIYEDDQGQAAQSVSAARKLINVNKVPAIIGGAMSSTAEAIIPICNQSKVVLLSPTATKPSLTQMGNYFFRLWPSDNYDGKIVAEAAYNKLGYRNISILYVNLAYGAGIAEVFEREFGKLGGKIVSKDGYAQGATDFRTVLKRIQGLNPDAIFVPGYVAEVTQILKEARELGIKTRFLGVNSLYDPKLIEIAGEAAEGAVFTYPTFDTKSEDPVVSRFVVAYKARYGTEPDAFAAQGYDSFRVMTRAVAKVLASSVQIDGVRIRTAILSIGPFSGPGGRFTFDENGDVQKPLRLLTINGGRFTELGQ